MDQISSLVTRPEFLIPFLLWTIFWKGWALWKSATKRQLVWFAILLVVNTASFLDIAYIFYLNRRDIDNGKILHYLENKGKRTEK